MISTPYQTIQIIVQLLQTLFALSATDAVEEEINNLRSLRGKEIELLLDP